MPKLKNVKREKFAQNIVNWMNQAQSYSKAWYTSKDPRKLASRLATNVDVMARIEEIRNRIEKKAIITREELMRWFKNNAELAQADGKYWDYNTAYANLGKIIGAYDEDNKQKQPNVNINTMSTDELLKLVRGN